MKYKVGLLIICIAGFMLRMYRLDGPSLWLDELHTFQRASLSLAGTLADLAVNPFPPLYYILMNIWIKIFGAGAAALRFPSVIFSTLSIFFIFKLAKELYGKEAGILAVLLLCISPYSINYAQEAKMYAMVWFFGIASFLFFYRYIRDNKARDLIFYVIATTLSIYTMYVGFLYIVVQNVFFLSLRKNRQTKAWPLGQLAIFFLYAPWIYRFIYHCIHRPTNFLYLQINNYFVYIYVILRKVIGSDIGKGSIVDQVIYGFLAIFAVVTFYNVKKFRDVIDLKKEDALLLTWIILPLVVYTVINKFMFPIFIIRYAGFIHIPLVILFAKGLCKFGRNYVIKYVLLILLLIITFSAHLYPYYKHGRKIGSENWKDVFNAFFERADKNSLIMTVHVEDFITRYFIKDNQIRIVKETEEKAKVLRYNRIFLVYHGFIYNPYDARTRALEIIKELPQYKITEKDDRDRIGFYWLEKK